MSYIGNQPTSVAFLTDQFSGNGTTTAFTMSVAPATTSSMLVAITGVVQDPSTYSIVGTTLTFSAAPPSGTGNISVRYLGIPASGVATTAYRTVTEFTATAGQTTFSVPSYTVGYIDVYRNGVMLGSADYTASNGTTVVLAAGASVGDLVTTESFYVSSVLNAIPATAGSIGTSYIANGAVTPTQLNTQAQYTGFKNRLINGNMSIWQRGTSFTLVSGATQYTSDRWYANTTGGAGVVARTGSVGSYSMQMTGASGVTVAFIGQKIESYNSADLAGQTVTVTATISSSTLTSLAWYTRFPTAQDNYAGVTAIANGTLTITSTPTQYTFSFSAPSGVTNGLELYFLTGAFTSGTLTITNVQLEKGSMATSFDYRDYGRELIMCQRYYEIGKLLATGYGNASYGTLISVPLKVNKRTTPTGTTADYNANTLNMSSIGITGIDENSMYVSATSTTAYYRASLSFTASSEL
jgi:hypothetical protein